LTGVVEMVARREVGVLMTAMLVVAVVRGDVLAVDEVGVTADEVKASKLEISVLVEEVIEVAVW